MRQRYSRNGSLNFGDSNLASSVFRKDTLIVLYNRLHHTYPYFLFLENIFNKQDQNPHIIIASKYKTKNHLQSSKSPQVPQIPHIILSEKYALSYVYRIKKGV